MKCHLRLVLLVAALGATALPVRAASTWTSNPADQGVLVSILGTGSNWTTSQPLRDGDLVRITGTWGGANMGSANNYYYVVGDGATSGTFSRFSQSPGATTFTPSTAANNPVPAIKVPTWYTSANWVGGAPNGVGSTAVIATNTSTWAVAIDRNVTLGSLTVDTSVVSSITNVSGTTTFPFTQTGLSLLATSRNAGPVSSLTFASAVGTPTVTVFGGNSLSFSEDTLTGATPGNSSGKLLIEGTQGLVINNQNPVQPPIVITTGTVYAPGAVRFGFGLDWTRFSGDLTLQQGVFQPLAGGSLNNNLSALPLKNKVILGTGTNVARIDIVNSATRPVIRGLESTSPNASIVNTTGTNSEAIEIGSYGQASDVFTFAGNIGATGTTASNAVRFFKDGPGTQYLTGTNQMDAFVANTVLVGVNGGKLSLGTTGQMGSLVGGVYTTNTNAAFGIKNGEFAISGVGVAAPRAQTYSGPLLFGVIAPNTTAVDANQTSRSSGLDTFTVEADPAQPATLTFGSVRNRNFVVASSTTPNLNGATMLYRGTNLGSGTGVAGNASIVFTTAPTTGTAGYLNAVSGTGAALGTPQAPVLKGALADTSASGNGAGFATYQASTGVRLLNPSTEQTAVATGAAYDTASVNDNIRLTLAADEAITGHSSNTLQIANSSGASRTVTNAGTGLYAANGLLFSGANPIVLTGGGITGVAGTNGEDVVIHSINTAGVTIQTPVTNTGTNTPSRPGWIVYNGPGNIRLEGAQTLGQSALSGTFFGGIAFNGTGTTTIASTIVSSSFVYVNQGTVKLDSGASWSNTPRLQVAGGATFDLNGITATGSTNRFSDIGPDWQVSGAAAGYMPVGGVVTNSGSTTVDLILSGAGGAASQPFFGTITGNLNLVVDKLSTNTQSLGNANTYTGETLIRSGVLNIARGGSLPATTVVRLGSLTTATNATLTMGDGNGSTNGPARMEIAGLYAIGSGTAWVQNQGSNISQLTLNIPAGTDNVYSGNLGAPIVSTGSTQNVFALRKIGSGTFEPTGAVVNYSGGTVVEGGVFRISSDSKLGQIGSLTGTAGSPGSPQAPISAFTNSLLLNGGALQLTTSSTFVLDPKRGIGLGPTDGATGGTGTITVDSGVAATYGGIIASAGNTGTQTFIKNGLGSLALNAASTFTGMTQVAAGTLTGTGSLASSLSVSAGATMAPGVGSIGTFSVGGGSTLAGTLAIQVDGTNAGLTDIFNVAGLFDLTSPTSTVDFSTLGTLDDPAYVFASYGSLSGTFGSVTNLPTGYAVDYAYLGNFIALVAVPEPTTYAILSGAAMALLIRRRRHRRD
ncbi:MAG: beta strand repeat-containing protein [Planctomycetaceae bacterium]